ncbi:hypothetical protein JX265_010399 [Neoarthrinium moseri]|uniref:Alpha/beta hydrolase fold-3 domain-containing protein n=1 Tax=Neoarthrinium moseri TaxID=1658444 RepID=A0A9Q0AIG5_9PEZI|nr:hypothetical protein JX265_010399 [Neoarthrinium moseri]
MAHATVFLYIIFATPWLLLRFLFDVSLYTLPRQRPDREWSFNQAVRVRAVRLVLLYWSLLRSGDRLRLTPGREGKRFTTVRPQSLKLYQGPLYDIVIRPEKLGVTWTPSPPSPAELASQSTTLALHFHGGGFVIGDGRDHDTGYLARTLVQHMGCTHVCTPQYRLSSHSGGQFPAPLQDAVTAYLHLLREMRISPRQVILSGDSAGGNLVLGLLRYIKDHGQELNIPPPGAVALWSPWVDVGAALHQDMKLSPNYPTDYLNPEFGRWGAETIAASGIIDPSGPYLSPLRHPFNLDTNIPMFVNAGEREVLCDDIEEFSKRFISHGWPLHLLVSKGCPHDILLLGPKMGFVREAEEAAADANAFLRSAAMLHLPTPH